MTVESVKSSATVDAWETTTGEFLFNFLIGLQTKLEKGFYTKFQITVILTSQAPVIQRACMKYFLCRFFTKTSCEATCRHATIQR
jgi:hypothetical protein